MPQKKSEQVRVFIPDSQLGQLVHDNAQLKDIDAGGVKNIFWLFLQEFKDFVADLWLIHT